MELEVSAFTSGLLLVPTLNQINPVHVIPTDLFNIHFNIILPSKPRPSQ